MVVAKNATTTRHGAIADKTQTHEKLVYNLDVIISVGYRVKSKRGTQFRIWATSVLKEYLIKGYAVRSNLAQQKYEDLKPSKPDTTSAGGGGGKRDSTDKPRNDGKKACGYAAEWLYLWWQWSSNRPVMKSGVR